MEFLRSYFIKNKPLSGWTLFSSNLDSSSKLLESHVKHFAKSSEWLSNVLITGESNFDEKSVQLLRGSFSNFLQNPYCRPIKNPIRQRKINSVL